MAQRVTRQCGTDAEVEQNIFEAVVLQYCNVFILSHEVACARPTQAMHATASSGIWGKVRKPNDNIHIPGTCLFPLDAAAAAELLQLPFISC
jgi:hypothetical protein